MPDAANSIRPPLSTVTDHQRAEARAHIELLRRQRENPRQLLERIQRDQPEIRDSVEKIAAYIDFSSSRLESLLPVISQDQYSSVDSVVLELIQNVDDAKYSHATCTPYLTFTLFPSKVILEYNEDGFTRDNVDRICDVNNSSKGEDDIGEKGIGFKSVFMIASKVHIESREYSFSFECRKGDSTTLRMLTPEYEATNYPPNEGTRITLTLLEDQSVRNDAIRAFREASASTLLFLRRIKKLSIIEHHEDGTRSSRCTSYEESETGEQGVLIKNDGIQSEKKFLIFSKIFSDIPTTGEKRKNPKAEVKLAFPLTPTNKPLIERQQDIFARLPIGKSGVGFHFLVHSDFSTSASRDSVDEKAKRNVALLDKIAELFQVAVNTFSTSNSDPYPLLRFQWMEFLPDDSVSSPFWSSLRDKIRSNLVKTPFLRSGSGRPELIGNLRYVPEKFRLSAEEGNEPLFTDVLPPYEKYLHSDYNPQLKRLRELGLKDLAIGDMLDRVKKDADGPLLSNMRTNTDKSWHKHVALFLLSCKKSYPKEWEKVLAFPLIPLIPASFNNWCCSVSKTDLYYPIVEGISIPDDLKISLVTEDAAKHDDRKQLLTALGVTEAPINLIRQRILGRYENGNEVSWKQSLNHLRFLWWTHPKDYKHDSTYGPNKIFNKNNKLVLPLSKEIFFDSSDPFGVRELFPSDSNLILHQMYLETPPNEKPGHPSWRKWLRDFIGVQEYPRLADRDNPTQLSPIFQRISNDFPDKVVRVLRAHWPKYKDQVNEPVRKKVSCIEVRLTTLVRGKLKEGDLPTPTLVKACESFAIEYPFLDLSPAITNGDLAEWEFLTSFGVNKELTLPFYFWILFYFRNREVDVVQDRVFVQERVFKLYLQIQCQCLQAESYQAAQVNVRTWFYKPRLFVPTPKTASFTWNMPEECLWDAPDYMQSKIPLLARYSSIPDVTIPTEFFRETLLIRNTTYVDLLEELDFVRREKSDVCYDNIIDIYVRLNTMRLANDSIREVIRERFEKQKLVWIQSDWKSPSSCLWSSKAQLTDKLTVSEKYGRSKHRKELKAFFVDCLKVTEPTLKMLAEELQLIDRSSLFLSTLPFESFEVIEKIKNIKIIMETINSLPLSESCPEKEIIRSSSIFPVRLGDDSWELKSAKTEFSIRDRENYWGVFNKKVPMLELTLAEVNELGPFLRWMDLEGRYLSNRVTERSVFSGTLEECSEKWTKDLKFRASALFRCAAHFKSPRAQKNDFSLLKLLSTAKVYQTSGISTYLDLSQMVNGKEEIKTALSSTSKLHIEQNRAKELRIFVPSDEKLRFVCYWKLLPEKLMSEVFMPLFSYSKTDTNPARVLAAVLNAPANRQMLEDLLTEFGIRGLPDWCKDDMANLSANLTELKMASSSNDSDGSDDGSDDSSDDENGSQTSVNSLPASLSLSLSGAKSAASISSYSESISSSSSAFRSASTVSRLITQSSHAITQHPHRVSQSPIPAETAPETFLESQNEYIRLLGNLMDAARQKTIPIHGSSELSSANVIEDHSDSDFSQPIMTTAFGTRALNQLRHDMKIGAAGELFIYELLKHLPLPSGRTLGFDESHWPSSIRDYVRVHPTCAHNFPECSKKREQADIIFDDKNGDFTQYMIDKQYLDESRFKGTKPKYFIEVKSTLKECHTKLYMSKSQYNLMHRLASETNDVVKEVYMIFRVFNLGIQDIGLRIYSNPRELKFVEESFSATPYQK